VAAALAAGNAVIVKPPSDNPLAVIKAVELLHEAGVPGEALQIVTARGSDLGNLLFDDPRIDAIAMTGSTDLGIEIASCASKHLIPCGLELGGNDPFILFPDGDMEEAAALAAFTRTGNAGQVCISPKRFIIHKSIVKEFTEKVLAHVKTIKMGFDEDLDAGGAELLSGKGGNVMQMGLMGPIINERAAKTVEQQIRHTMDQGATLLYGGKRNGTFVEPTIFTGVTRDMDIAKDMEIFGPVIPIIEFETVEEAIEIANQSIFGLSGCVFTKDWQLGMRVAQEVQSGGMIVNGTSLYRNLMQPFGGYKMSGMGREGFVTLGEMMQEKTIIFKGFLS
jgi:succinate-semialdehyde dehydrogenase/glutarate-semialdehyde dehydrogenase